MDDDISGPSPSRPASESGLSRKRKLRKGTRSCWECKRRKGKCVFASQNDPACADCRRRGLKCTSQDLPEVLSPAQDGRRQFGDQIGRVQSLLNDIAGRLVGDTPNTGAPREDAPRPPRSIPSVVPPTPPSTSTTSDATRGSVGGPPSPQRSLEAISNSLLDALPCLEDTETLLKSVHRVTFYCHKLNAEHQKILKKEDIDNTSSRVWSIPDSRTHPVIIAKEMLFWVLFLQGPWYHRDLRFSESPFLIMQRLVDAVISLVTTNDELHGSLESLECIMLEGLYHSHSGNIRRAWMVYRKAMLLAQLMGLHRSTRRPFKSLDSKVTFNPESMWCRLMFVDRQLCLLLGLPQGTNGNPMTTLGITSSGEFSEKRLERSLTIIAGRILQRNELGSYSYADDQLIDAELLAASQGLPETFWRPPKFDGIIQGSFEDVSDMSRLATQVFHFHLLNQLHLPYMLSSIHRDGSLGEDGQQDYSTMTCANASREILGRFISYRSFNHAAMCFRLVDFTALTAALALLLIHLDRHLPCMQGDTNGMAKQLLCHQRPNDRTLLAQVLETLDLVSQYNGDAMSIESAKLLRLLLNIEDEAAHGKSYHWMATKIEVDDGDGSFLGQEVRDNGDAALQVSIPCFGAIHISPGACMSKTRLCGATRLSSLEYVDNQGQSTTVSANSPVARDTVGSSDSTAVSVDNRDIPNTHTRPEAVAAYSRGSDGILSGTNSGVTAGINDWALQGVDMAFFDNFLMDS